MSLNRARRHCSDCGAQRKLQTRSGSQPSGPVAEARRCSARVSLMACSSAMRPSIACICSNQVDAEKVGSVGASVCVQVQDDQQTPEAAVGSEWPGRDCGVGGSPSVLATSCGAVRARLSFDDASQRGAAAGAPQRVDQLPVLVREHANRLTAASLAWEPAVTGWRVTRVFRLPGPLPRCVPEGLRPKDGAHISATGSAVAQRTRFPPSSARESRWRRIRDSNMSCAICVDPNPEQITGLASEYRELNRTDTQPCPRMSGGI